MEKVGRRSELLSAAARREAEACALDCAIHLTQAMLFAQKNRLAAMREAASASEQAARAALAFAESMALREGRDEASATSIGGLAFKSNYARQADILLEHLQLVA